MVIMIDIIGLVIKPKSVQVWIWFWNLWNNVNIILEKQNQSREEDMIAETLWINIIVYLKTYKEALSVHDSLIECTMDTVHD